MTDEDRRSGRPRRTRSIPPPIERRQSGRRKDDEFVRRIIEERRDSDPRKTRVVRPKRKP